MGERKVINKYFPPDFDPAKIPRRRQPKSNQMKVRMMLPMSIRCKTCANYIYKGTKFNSRKEDVKGETYLDIRIFRFYFNCTKCSSEITIRTDPQNSDYIVESGASRNFEPWREEDKAAADTDERGAMESLENRMSDSKREMDIVSALDEMISMKTRRKNVSLDSMLEGLRRSGGEKEDCLEEDDDESLIKLIVFKGSRDYVHRIKDEGDDEVDGIGKLPAKRRKGSQEELGQTQPFGVKAKSSMLKVSVVKRNLRHDEIVGCSGLQSLSQSYNNSDED